MQAQPLIAVRNVEASSRWYRAVLGCESGHGGQEYERIVEDGRLIRSGFQTVWKRRAALVQTDDFDGVVARVREMDAAVLEGPQVNPSANHREIWLRDPDGYVVVIAGRYGDIGAS